MFQFIYSNNSKLRYPPGKRLNPESSPGGQNMRPQLCYIPTAEEAEEEEQLSRNEYPRGRRTSKVSINIDQNKKEYSGMDSDKIRKKML